MIKNILSLNQFICKTVLGMLALECQVCLRRLPSAYFLELDCTLYNTIHNSVLTLAVRILPWVGLHPVQYNTQQCSYFSCSHTSVSWTVPFTCRIKYWCSHSPSATWYICRIQFTMTQHPYFYDRQSAYFLELDCTLKNTIYSNSVCILPPVCNSVYFIQLGWTLYTITLLINDHHNHTHTLAVQYYHKSFCTLCPTPAPAAVCNAYYAYCLAVSCEIFHKK